MRASDDGAYTAIVRVVGAQPHLVLEGGGTETDCGAFDGRPMTCAGESVVLWGNVSDASFALSSAE